MRCGRIFQDVEFEQSKYVVPWKRNSLLVRDKDVFPLNLEYAKLQNCLLLSYSLYPL